MTRAAPLFHWQQMKIVEAVRHRRVELQQAIRRYPRRSFRRVILEARLKAATDELLRLEKSFEQEEKSNG